MEHLQCDTLGFYLKLQTTQIGFSKQHALCKNVNIVGIRTNQMFSLSYFNICQLFGKVELASKLKNGASAMRYVRFLPGHVVQKCECLGGIRTESLINFKSFIFGARNMSGKKFSGTNYEQEYDKRKISMLTLDA